MKDWFDNSTNNNASNETSFGVETYSKSDDLTHDAIICFASHTHIQTPAGDRQIRTLNVGDLVVTRDNGPQPIRWIGQTTVRASGALAPVRFAKGVMGNYSALLVSPRHKMLNRRSGGLDEVLVPAKHLVDNFQVTTQFGGMITYVHMLFDRHEIIRANGALSESFYPGTDELQTLTEQARNDVFALFPGLRTDVGQYGPLSRNLAANSATL